MTVAAGKAAARSYFEEVLNRGSMAVADATEGAERWR